MAGIIAYGAYIPLYRIKREEMARAWGGAGATGERSVANWDEDSLTLAVAAAIDCLGDEDRNSIDALYLATTTCPYQEKQGAALVAATLDLKREVLTIDFTDSLRAGTLAIRAALDAVAAGSAQRALVIASDCRLGAPRSDWEQLLGDGAAAFLIGKGQEVAQVEGFRTHSLDFLDVWRTRKDDFLHSHEDRFIFTQGYLSNIAEGVSALLKERGLSPKGITRAVLSAPDSRRLREAAGALGLDLKSQVQDGLLDRVGNTGAALAPMLLVAALEQAQGGETILVGNYGDGADALLLHTTPLVAKRRPSRGIQGFLASKRYLGSYEKYISFRSLMTTEPPRRPAFVSYPPVLMRDRKWVLGFNGSRCQCGRLFFPPQRICLYCQAKDRFSYERLSDKQGTLFSFTRDSLALSVDPPEVYCLVHLEDQVRVYTRLTDRDPDQLSLDMPVEMTFRRFHDAGGYPNYFWKAMPVRG